MDTQQKLDRYRELLLKWTRTINLIGPEARASVDQHIGEAVEGARLLSPAGNVLDFGSGGGLPAIPMAICSPDARFHLVEADQRKWAFLKTAVRECGLNSTVHGDRLTALLPRLPEDLRFSLVTSRAVGEPERWVPEVAPWLTDGGRVALFTRPDAVPQIQGFALEAIHPLPRGVSNVLVVLKALTHG